MKPVALLPCEALYSVETSRRIEQALAARGQAMGPHHLMASAGLALAQLALAIAPHARKVWIACGPGNNGGDGLIAATHLVRAGKQVVITRVGGASPSENTPPDARWALDQVQQSGLTIETEPKDDDLISCDLVIDALLGIGAKSALRGPLLLLATRINTWHQRRQLPVLAVDIPSGLLADTGYVAANSTTPPHDSLTAVQATHTLSLVCLRPGLFTAMGRQLCGHVWLEDLGAGRLLHETSHSTAGSPYLPIAYWSGFQPLHLTSNARSHASHKGNFGDVAVIGGEAGMQGAALLAAQAAHQTGAGRVRVSFLEDSFVEQRKHPDQTHVVHCPHPIAADFMFGPWQDLDFAQFTVVCGCGGGKRIVKVLPTLLQQCHQLVLDADALNALARDAHLIQLLRAREARGWATVLTPHPKEASRLLNTDVPTVQSNRLAAAHALVELGRCSVILKGSGSVIAAPGRLPTINATGNGKLAVGGSGDVLAGMVGSYMAQGHSSFNAAQAACYWHGWVADQWPARQTLSASALAAHIPQA